MRKKLLIFVAIISFILSPLAFANTNSNINTTLYRYNYNNGEKFTFVEKGITFSIFQNGEFDFYINPRNGIHTNVNFDTVSISYNSGYDYNAYVQYDDYGAIIQIENVPVYYDHYGRVTQVGNVRVNYFGNRLSRIGGLHVYYNNYGYYSHHAGFINHFNRVYVFNPFHNFFVRPLFNRCVVSYNPYRRYYRPYRYDYYYGKNNYSNNYYKNNRKNKTFRKIDSRIRTANSGRTYQKRSTNESRIARNNTSVKSQSSQRNNNRSIRSNDFVKKQVSKRNVQSQRNRTLNTNNRIVQNARKERSATSQRR
ncbi:MAG: hypothetical protein KAH72_10505, partial [Flavobacteriaceae bacterium]|nr:hypothetical protein [Flavobacteriaceae bacterium]